MFWIAKLACFRFFYRKNYSAFIYIGLFSLPSQCYLHWCRCCHCCCFLLLSGFVKLTNISHSIWPLDLLLFRIQTRTHACTHAIFTISFVCRWSATGACYLISALHSQEKHLDYSSYCLASHAREYVKHLFVHMKSALFADSQ